MVKQVVLLYWFYRWGHWGSGRWSDWSKDIEPAGGRDGLLTQTSLIPVSVHLTTILYRLHEREAEDKISEDNGVTETKVCRGVCNKLTVTKSSFLWVTVWSQALFVAYPKAHLPFFSAVRVLLLSVNTLPPIIQVNPDWSKLILVASSLLSGWFSGGHVIQLALLNFFLIGIK